MSRTKQSRPYNYRYRKDFTYSLNQIQTIQIDGNDFNTGVYTVEYLGVYTVKYFLPHPLGEEDKMKGLGVGTKKSRPEKSEQMLRLKPKEQMRQLTKKLIFT